MRNAIITAALATICLSTVALAQSSDISLKATEIIPGLTMLEGEGGFVGGNMTLLTGDDATVLIDDGLEPFGSLLLEAINMHAERPVDFVINTHVHGDHVGSNRILHLAGATIVGHDNIRKRLMENGWQTDQGSRPPKPGELPQVTFSDAVTFHLNGHTAYVFHVDHAHTDGDSVIHFTDINVISSGDVLFNGLFPFIDLDSGGSVAGYLAAQERILELADQNTRIIPGHGPLASKADLQAAHDMLFDANARIKSRVDAGKTEQQILSENPLADYDADWSWDFISTETMTKALYRSNNSH